MKNVKRAITASLLVLTLAFVFGPTSSLVTNQADQNQSIVDGGGGTGNPNGG